MEVDIHNFEKRVEQVVEKLNELDEVNRNDILKFLKQLSAEGKSAGRIMKYVYTLKTLGKMLNKPFRNAIKENIIDLVSRIETNKNWTDSTKHDFKVILRIFFRWLRQTEDYPPEVKWVKITLKKNNNKLPEEILTKEEVEKLADATDNLRDKAFILTLYESGCRIGELLPIKIKHIQFDEYGCVLIVNGKTGSRRVRLIEYAKDLTNWLDIHPLKNNPEAFVWITTGNRNRYELLSYNSIRFVIEKAAKMAGIAKAVNPHSFRHARATYLASKLTEQQLKVYFGWCGDSRMASTYVHLSGKDIDDALLKLHGFKPEENKELKNISIKTCPKCNENNSILSQFCKKCGFPLDTKTMLEIDENRRKLDEFMFEMFKRMSEKYPRIKRDFKQLVKEKNLEEIFE
jgi:site-specific recombinase XerD/ribosomal protein L40E